MAAAEARVAWQRTAVNRHIHEDVVKAPKLAHCPSLKKQDSHSYYLGNSWDSLDTKVDLLRQINSSTHRDYRSEYFGGEDVCGMQFKPSLQAFASERDNKKGYKDVPSENSIRNEDDPGWQFLMDPKPKSSYAPEREPLDRKFGGNILASSLVEDGKEKSTVADATIDGSIMAQEILTKILPEYSDHSSISSFEVEELSKTSEIVGIHGKKEVDYMVREQTTWSASNSISSKAGSSWRTADKETLAVLVAQRTSEKLENCDLPTPRSGFKCKTSPDSWDMLEDTPLDVSKSLDRELLASVFQDDGKVSCLRDLGLQKSAIHGRSEPTLTIIPPATSKPINISSGPNTPARTHLSKSYSSVDNKNTSWSGNGQGTSSLSSKGLSPMAEALCHSQTRAREAEQKVDEATKECKRLSDMYFREASLSLMYRYWITSLQAENTWLKMCLKNPQGAIWLKHSFSSASAVLDHLSKNPWMHFKKENLHRRMLRYFSSIWQPRDSTNSTARNDHGDTSIILGCTIGFAFVLGFTLAGAGLALGWRMGWILVPS